MTPPITSARTRIALLRKLMLAALLAIALSGLTIGQAQARPKVGNGPAVTCPGGGKPGQTAWITVTSTVNGKVIDSYEYQAICGNDGQWHPIAQGLPGTVQPPQLPGTVTTIRLSDGA